MNFEKRGIVIKEDWAFESDFLPFLDTFVTFTSGMCMPARSNLEPNEKAGSMADQLQNAKEDDLDIDSPETVR